MAWAIYKGTFILNPYLHICKKCLNGNPVKILQQTLSSCNKTKKLGFILKIWGSCLDKKHFFQTLDWNTTRPINMFPSLDLACYRSTINCYVLIYFPQIRFFFKNFVSSALFTVNFSFYEKGKKVWRKVFVMSTPWSRLCQIFVAFSGKLNFTLIE